MKKTISVLGWGMFVSVILLPLGSLLCACFGYTFKITSIPCFSTFTAILSVCLMILSIQTKETAISKVPFAIFTPLSLINAVFYIPACRSAYVIVCMLICMGCSLYLTITFAKPSTLKAIALALSALMIFPACFLGFITLSFGSFGKNTVVKTIESPSKAYYAEIIDSDQGALGGNTQVDVYENKRINAFIFQISKKPQRVYLGNSGEFQSMEIYWKDDGCLVINSAEYKIK